MGRIAAARFRVKPSARFASLRRCPGSFRRGGAMRLARGDKRFEVPLSTAFADISLVQLALIAAMGILTSLIGGVAGYGTGALMPLVLVPLVCAEPVVAIIALGGLFTNVGRAAAFHQWVDRPRTLIVCACAVPPPCWAPGSIR